MATTPNITLRDGSGFTTSLEFTTNQEAIIVTGTVTVDTAAVQISINGGPFSSDPTLILFDLQNITVPNPNTYPSGLQLPLGLNTLQLRAVDIVGAVSAASVITVTRILTTSDVITQTPTGVRIRRNRNSVDVLALKPILISTQQVAPIAGQSAQRVNTLSVPATTTFRGFNFYASSSPGGATGYFKINAAPVSATTEFQEDVITSDNDLAIWDNTTLKNVRIRVTEENDFGQILAVRYDNSYSAASLAEKLRFTDTFESYHLNEFVVFTHVRTGGVNIINSEQFASVQDADPLYYVVSAVFFDSALGKEVETPYSQEVLGSPLVIDTTIRDLPGRNAVQITTDYIQAVQRVNADIAMIPGSTTRDVSIDPFASEAERLWFVIDFVHRSQSFLTLLQIDNVNGSGTSDAVSASPYKTALKAALGLQTDGAVQALLDAQFDKLAANSGKTRLAGRPAVGTVLIFTPTLPLRDTIIPSNSYVSAGADPSQNLPGVRFLIAGAFTIPVVDAAAYYDFDTKRYQIRVDVVCESTGAMGNRSAGTITQIAGVAGVQVINDAATVFGDDRETNADLANRAMLGFVSVDTGTEGGYASTSSTQIGIVRAKVVKSGDSLMMRDYDPVRRHHLGGKVDIWVQGTSERTVTETFAFTYEIAQSIQCAVIDLSNLVFRVLDSRVTPSTPIIEVLNNPVQGLGVRNATSGMSFDLTGVQILDYQTFKLDPTLPTQSAIQIDDVIDADYRFRVANTFLFGFQPVRRVVSVVGEVSGPLDPGHNLVFDKSDDPLLTGSSTIAKDTLSVVQYNGIPSGATLTVNNETHVFIGFFEEPLLSVGINLETIRVFSSDRVTEYNGPSSTVPDYDLISGTATTPTKLIRTATSAIVSGQTVSVDYVHDENFTVSYVINDLLQQLQAVVNRKRHLTADVLVKEAIQNQVNIETTVQLDSGATKTTVDPNVRTATSRVMNTKTVGQGVAQSNVDSSINDTKGVDFNVLPFALMAYADGSIKLREPVNSAFQVVQSLAIGANVAYMLTGALEYPTSDGGGLPTEPRGVFQDDGAFVSAPSLPQVATSPGQAFIIGAAGATIAGYSDDATLTAQGFVTPSQILVQRLSLTANRVVVSLSGAGASPDVPTNHSYAVSYVVRGMTGSHDIVASAVEFVDLGNFTVTYRSATTA